MAVLLPQTSHAH